MFKRRVIGTKDLSSGCPQGMPKNPPQTAVAHDAKSSGWLKDISIETRGVSKDSIRARGPTDVSPLSCTKAKGTQILLLAP